MTTSASDRSEGICAALARAEAAFDGRGWVEMPKADRNRYVTRAMLAKPIIAAAITQAENEKLEEAAQAMERSADRYISEAGSTDYDDDVNLLRELADLTRTLKTPKD